ncbi:MAG: hypothetical protein ABIK09_06935 [Pseudomonadota bacterium]
MLTELEALFAGLLAETSRGEYAAAIIEENLLAKATASTRKLTNQRLGEMYALDRRWPLFRVLRRLWDVDKQNRGVLALLAVLARDPLLRTTAPAILGLRPGDDLVRGALVVALKGVVGERLNEAILDKVVRNCASSWTQSGHLVGRTLKKRALVAASPAAVAFALYLARSAGFLSDELLTSGWVSVLDCSPNTARDLAVEAKRMGLVDLRVASDIFEIAFDRLEPGIGGR